LAEDDEADSPWEEEGFEEEEVASSTSKSFSLFSSSSSSPSSSSSTSWSGLTYLKRSREGILSLSEKQSERQRGKQGRGEKCRGGGGGDTVPFVVLDSDEHPGGALLPFVQHRHELFDVLIDIHLQRITMRRKMKKGKEHGSQEDDGM